MKNFTYAFIFLFAIVGCRSELPNKGHTYCPKQELIINPHLVPYLNAFVDDCEKRGINPDHPFCLNWIKTFTNTHHTFQGQTCFDDSTILIYEPLLEDSIGTKFVLYHELGHWYGLGHSDGIMKENYNSDDTEWVKENWDVLLEDYFDKLKNQ